MSRKLLTVVQPKSDSINENSNKILTSNYAVGTLNTVPNNSNNNGKQSNLMRKIKLASTPT